MDTYIFTLMDKRHKKWVVMGGNEGGDRGWKEEK